MDLSPEAIILKELVKPKEIKETHISYAMITDDYVYKLKKPVDFGFLDYRLSKSRRNFCILEKELNSRFSKDVYLDVLKIARFGKEMRLVPHTNTMFAIDYVLKMRRIKDEDFFSNRVQNGLVDEKLAYKVGKNIAELFKKIETPVEKALEFGSFDVIKYNCEENFMQTEKYVGSLLDEKIYNYIKEKTLNFLEENKSLFENRLKGGFIKDGHGDLRLEHVYFDNDEIGLIDCIEFNKRFRYNDVVSEIAFLAMEMDINGYIDLSDSLIAGFFSVFDDENSKKLLNFYKCYRAYVRAKVTCFLLEEKGETWENYANVKNSLDRHVDAAFSYALNMDDNVNLVFYGIMGSGKSKNGKAFSDKYFYSYFNTDIERKRIAGLNPETKVLEDFGKGIYSKEFSLKVYERLAENVILKNSVCRPAIIDGSFSKKDYFDKLDEKNINYKKILFTAPDEIIVDRLKKRESKKTVSDGRLELLQAQKSSFETKELADLTIETTKTVESNLAKIADFLIRES
ncbi:AAA family ATPase [Deferribacter thermophilus]|uniref:bifunctional aminoglycoside phosphotransferase/ATP-binding protein n=1 Tax=Deferribacter thermophilus TaxID=53573 RepID=UPI003C1F3ED4